jgi:hypothetical protein
MWVYFRKAFRLYYYRSRLIRRLLKGGYGPGSRIPLVILLEANPTALHPAIPLDRARSAKVFLSINANHELSFLTGI